MKKISITAYEPSDIDASDKFNQDLAAYFGALVLVQQSLAHKAVNWDDDELIRQTVSVMLNIAGAFEITISRKEKIPEAFASL